MRWTLILSVEFGAGGRLVDVDQWPTISTTAEYDTVRLMMRSISYKR